MAVRDLVVMLDMEIAKKSPLTAEFLSRVREDRGVLSVDGQEPRCAVITPSTVYLSPISLPTLRRRLEAAYGALEDEGPGPVVDKGRAV
ncbi:MAG: hypothetical protein H5T95_07020 [Firmicutes bacterium]|nr:hypothetical protein [Bacillota bacterium]